jgi:hypothetical protein
MCRPKTLLTKPQGGAAVGVELERAAAGAGMLRTNGASIVLPGVRRPNGRPLLSKAWVVRGGVRMAGAGAALCGRSGMRGADAAEPCRILRRRLGIGPLR